jgi:hypothetical protein
MTTRPGQVLYLDFMTMNKVQGANQVAKYLLVIVDAFSSYIFAFPTLDMESGTVIKILRFLTSTIPNIQTLVSDNQTSLLVNKEVAGFLERQQISVRTVIAYSSKSNLCENANKQVRSMLRIYQLATGLNWLKCLDPAIKALNTISHTHGKMGSISPFEMFFRLPPDFQDPLKANSISEEMLKEKILALKEIRQLRYDSIEQMMKERLEKSQIKEGGLVRLLNINRTDKQTPNYLPNTFKITKLHNHLVLLQDVNDPQITHRVHIDRVKPIHQLSESVVNHLRPKQLEMLGQDNNLAKATSSITREFSDSESDEEESDDELSNPRSDPNNEIKDPIILEKSKSLIDPELNKSIKVLIDSTKKPISPKTKIIEVTKEDVDKTSKSTVPPSTVSIQPSDSVSQVGKSKSKISKAMKDMSKIFKTLSPKKKKKQTKLELTTPDKLRIYRNKEDSDESPEKFLTPEGTPEKEPIQSTEHQGAIPKTKFVLKPSKFDTPLQDPITIKTKKIKRDKRKAYSPDKDDLELPEPKQRPKRDLPRIDFKILHTTGKKVLKEPNVEKPSEK